MNGTVIVNVDQFKDALFFSLTLRQWSNRSKVKNPEALQAYLALLNGSASAPGATVAVEGAGKGQASKATTTTKSLVRSEKLEAIIDFLNTTKAKLVGPFGRALPSRIKEGLFVVKKDLVETFEGEIKEAKRKLREELIPAFLADYDAAIQRAKNDPVNQGGLGPLWSAADYPSEQKLAGMFSIESQWLALGVPEDLPEALRKEQAEQFQRQMQEAAQEVKDALRGSLAEFVDHLLERLTTNPGEKPKVFRDTLIGNIQQFCEVFDSRNIMNDSELASLVSKAKSVIQGVDPDKLRKFSSVREQVKTGFAEIKAALDPMIEEQRSRKFNLED